MILLSVLSLTLRISRGVLVIIWGQKPIYICSDPRPSLKEVKHSMTFLNQFALGMIMQGINVVTEEFNRRWDHHYLTWKLMAPAFYRHLLPLLGQSPELSRELVWAWGSGHHDHLLGVLLLECILKEGDLIRLIMSESETENKIHVSDLRTLAQS